MSNEESDQQESEKINYEILREDYPNYDLSFKVIVIGNSSNYILYLINFRCWKIMSFFTSDKKKIRE